MFRRPSGWWPCMTSQYHLPLRLRIQPSPLLLLDMLLPFPSNNVFRATIVAQPNRQEKPHFSPKLTDITQLKTHPGKVHRTPSLCHIFQLICVKCTCKLFMNRFIMIKPRGVFHFSRLLFYLPTQRTTISTHSFIL